MANHGTFYWNELMTRDAEKAKAFYASTLDWTSDGIPEHWFSYIAVDDVDARVERAEAEGGKIRRPAFEVPGIGRIVILEDSNGAAMGWMTPAAQE